MNYHFLSLKIEVFDGEETRYFFDVKECRHTKLLSLSIACYKFVTIVYKIDIHA